MLKRTFPMLLAAVLAAVSFGLRDAGAQVSNGAAEKARAGVMKAGVGEKARVEVRLRDHTKLKGYVSEAGADSFTVTDAKTGAARAVAYSDVSQVKRPGGLSSSTKAIIWGGVAAAAVITLYTVRGAFCDGMC